MSQSSKRKKNENNPAGNILVAFAMIILLTISLIAVGWILKLDGAVWLVDRITQGTGITQTTGGIMGPVVSESTGAQPDIFWRGWQDGTIAIDSADLLSKADMGADVLTSAARDTKVIVIGQEGRWLNVRCGGFVGWMQESSVQLSGERTVYTTDAQGAADTEEAQITDLVDTEHKSTLDARARAYNCVGVSAAVIKDGEVAYTYEYGYANAKSKTPMTSDTKIRVASITKVLIAMTALSMRDMELVDLDAPVSDYLEDSVYNPRYPDTPITMRQLLTHTSSFTDFGVDGKNVEGFYKKLYSSQNFAPVRPGTVNAWKYNNSGLCAAGAILERAGGATLVDYTRGYFFEPLGMDASLWAGDIKEKDKIASLYYEDHSLARSASDQTGRPYYQTPGDNFCLYAGDLTISAQDLARLECILINDGTYHDTFYLYPQSVEELEREHYDLGPHTQCLTLCKREDQLDSRTLYYHNGKAFGVLSYMSYDPQTRDGVVVITTGADSDQKSRDSYMACRTFAEYFYGTLLKE